MTLDEFAQITLTVAAESGIDAYAPTLIAREAVQVVQGIPEQVDHREAIQQVIRQAGLEHADYFFGVRSGPREITTGHHRDGTTRFVRILGLGAGFSLLAEDACPWWTLDGAGDPDRGH